MKASKQAAANCDRFEALVVGAHFQIVARRSWRCIETYMKVDADTVEASDGRRWAFAITQGSGSSVVLVPQGAYTVADYDCDLVNGRKVA